MKVTTPAFTQGESVHELLHLSIIERSKLEILHQQGKSARAIAEELGRHHATICRELHRNIQTTTLPSRKLPTSLCMALQSFRIQE